MEYSTEWLQFCKTEKECFTYRFKLVQDEKALAHDLKKALQGAGDNQIALRLLLEVKPKSAVVKPLFPDIINWAVDSGNLTSIDLAKNVLLSYSKEYWVREVLQSEVKKYMADNDDWHYRRIAEIYKLLDYR
jgi:hypothetical protein